MTAGEWLRRRCAAELGEAAGLLRAARTERWEGQAGEAYAERLDATNAALAALQHDVGALGIHLERLAAEQHENQLGS